MRKLTEEREELSSKEYLDFPSYVWLLAAFKGYFPRVKEICLVKEYENMEIFRKE